ncbi:tautomerase family protein [Mangrovicoccus sp. HB161399]|uniref:tautomerase family protein n=1 Tax=Mangrovicoccus sp. HB161399 TaxID=2720392 RepID=UPI001552D2FB|nr:tautomerase family protein [Mangrovicoccus sp. HB161399]
MVIGDVGQSRPRTAKAITVPIARLPRTLASRRAFFRLAADRLEADCGLPQGDLMINMVTASESGWSFGSGKAQFLGGEL